MIDPSSTSNPFLDEEGSSEEEENVLFVKTHDDVKFVIRLFAASKNMIVVEIQRTSGCTFAFRDAAKTLLRAVASSAAKKHTRTGPAAGRAPRRFTLPFSLPQRSKEDLQQCIQDDFQIAYKMILSPKYETQVLGLESMEQMTRGTKNKSGRNEEEVKNVVARSVLGQGRGGAAGEDGDTDTPSCECLKQLLLLLDTTATTSCQSSSCVLLQRKILTVLANSLEVLHNNKTMSTIGNNGVSSNSRSRTNDTATTHNKNEEDRTAILFLTTHTSFLAVLLSTVQATPVRRPHDTFPAVRCLRSLLLLVSCCAPTGEECLVTAIRNTTHPTAMESLSSYAGGNDNGTPPSHPHHHHEGLEQESTLLLAQLQQQLL